MKRLPIVALSLLLPVAAGASLAIDAPLDLESGRPMVQLTVNGEGPYPFVFDTGSPMLLVMQSLVDELGLEVVGSDELQSPMQGAPVEVDVVRVDSIALAGAVVEDLEARVLDMDGRGLGRGVVGPALFRAHGALTLDLARNAIALGREPPAEVTTWLPFGDGARFGLRAMPLPGAPIQVLGTDPGSRAEAIGLLPGDRIVAINGKAASELDIGDVRTELSSPELVLTVDRGGRTIQLGVPGSGS